jgi:hypothetical protein
MSEAMRPLVPHDISAFIRAPGQADVLFIDAVTFFIISVLVIGSFAALAAASACAIEDRL